MAHSEPFGHGYEVVVTFPVFNSLISTTPWPIEPQAIEVPCHACGSQPDNKILKRVGRPP